MTHNTSIDITIVTILYFVYNIVKFLRQIGCSVPDFSMLCDDKREGRTGMSNAHAKYHTESERKIGLILWQHALAQDLEEVTVLQICQEAGVSRGTFYRHFSNPKQALGDVISDYQTELLRSDSGVVDSFSDFLIRLLYLTDPDEPFRRYMEMLFDADLELRLKQTLKDEMSRRGLFDPVNRNPAYLSCEKDILTDAFCGAFVNTLRQWASGAMNRQEVRDFMIMIYDRLIRCLR